MLRRIVDELVDALRKEGTAWRAGVKKAVQEKGLETQAGESKESGHSEAVA